MSSEVIQTPHLSMTRLILLGMSSVVLCLSFIMAIFAPFPISLAVILYGRWKGYLISLCGLVICYLLASVLYRDYTLLGFYFCVLIFGLGIAEILLRGYSPIKSVVVFGLIFISLVIGLFGMKLNEVNMTPKQLILEQLKSGASKLEEQKKIVEMSNDPNALEVLQLLDRPEYLADQMLELFPGYFFIAVFLILWFNMFLALKGRRLLFSGNDYPYSEKNLLNFKVPFGWVFILSLGLILAVWGKDLGTNNLEIVGFTLIRCLGIFYFFQGFGVLSDAMNFLGLGGFFRSLIVMIVIFMASYLIAVVGLFDNWFDFRRYFLKKKTED